MEHEIEIGSMYGLLRISEARAEGLQMRMTASMVLCKFSYSDVCCEIGKKSNLLSLMLMTLVEKAHKMS